MADFDVALVRLGTLLGLFAAPDDASPGSVRWQWFTDPLGEGFASMPRNREELGGIVEALLGNPAADFGDDDRWAPFGEWGGVGLGFTWSKSAAPASDPLRIGLGASVDAPVAGQQIELRVLARILRILGAAKDVDHELGQVSFAGSFPVPSFLAKGELGGSVSPTPADITVWLAATETRDNVPDRRQLTYLHPPGEVLAWDTARLAVFVLRAWIRQQAAGGDDFFTRVNDHLFPMLGDPADPIDPFPLVDPMGQPATFDPWADSVLSTDGGAAGPLTFLWHAKALLTGVESPDFLSGSMFFPLAPGGSGPAPADLADALGTYVAPPPDPGAWVGILTEPAGTCTLVLDVKTATQYCRIPLATATAAGLTRPDLTPAQHQAILATLASIGPGGLPIADQLLHGGDHALTLLSVTVAQGDAPVGLDGEYRLDVVIPTSPSDPVRLSLLTPLLDLAFPLQTAEVAGMVGGLVTRTVKAALPDDDLGPMIAAAADVAQACLAVAGGNGGPAPDELALTLLSAVLAAAGQGEEITVPIEGFTLTVGFTGGLLSVNVGFGPIAPESDDDPQISVGSVNAGVVVKPDGPTFLDGFQVGFTDLRLGTSQNGGGIVASLIPDMRELSGFSLMLTYSASSNPPVMVTGGGKIPIQQTLGPLEIAALLVDIRADSMAIGLDLGFELGPILVAAYELGLEIGFLDGSVTPFLHGLGLSMDTDAIKLGGFFAAVENDGTTDYVGGALVSVAGYFELSAIGGYTQLADETPSLFLFASLVAPLGGPPWFFMTGVAGGFGFNRTLPAPGLMTDHPFLKVMSGQLAISGDAVEALTELSTHFAAQKGQHWIAAGIQFVSFGFINGKVVIAIGFGHHLSFTILGMASFSLEPLAYIEIGIEATADEEHFSVRARLSPSSYVLHPDIFSLQGDIALCAWYAPPHDGDFLFSIGGYHPLFKKPEHYPELVRVGCTATLYDFVHLSIEVFFACTPQALMAGAKAALWAEFMGIAAGLEVYVDVLMTWDPFFLRARMGVCVWFEFFGRHEIGVDLDIWTPDFGGEATIDLAIVSFTVSFGTDLLPPPKPPIADFLAGQLGLPATPQGDGAKVATFSTEAAPGLFRIEFLSGRSGKPGPPTSDEAQEGLSASDPVHLGPEWSFLLRTRIPVDHAGAIQGSFDPDAPAPGQFEGIVNMPLTGRLGLGSTVDVGAPALFAAARTWLGDWFPAATFGPKEVTAAQANASQAAADVKPAEASVALVEGLVVEVGPTFPANTPALTAPLVEPPDPGDAYPAPLGATAASTLALREPFRFGIGPAISATISSRASRRASALAAMAHPGPRVITGLAHSAALLNKVKQSAGQVLTVAVAAAAGAGPVVAVPASPARPAALSAVSLRQLPVRSDHVVARSWLETVTPAAGATHTPLTPRGRPAESLTSDLELPAGRFQQVDFGDRMRSGSLTVTGDQVVRTIVLDAGGHVVSDRHRRGKAAVPLGPRTATVLLIGAGTTPAPTVAGLEPETTLLALRPGLYAGPGCVVRTPASADLTVRATDSLPGAEVFATAQHLWLSMAVAFPKEGTLVLRVVPTVERPGSAAEQVRWRTSDAVLRGLTPVVASGRVAFVMGLRAPGAWELEVDLGPDWRLAGVAAVPRAARTVVAELSRRGEWDLVDDAIPDHPRSLTSEIRLEARA